MLGVVEGRSTRPNGDKSYGSITIDGVQWKVHRWTWTLANGDIQEGLFVLHHCDNPPCCNPGHLFLGTALDNSIDMHSKGRAIIRRGDAHPMRKLNAEAVICIRRRVTEGTRSKDIAEELGVSKATISLIVNRKTWTHI